MQTVLVLGMYDRDSVGHDAYVVILRRLLERRFSSVIFAHPDDIPCIARDVDVVVVGGGDVLTPAFLDSVRRLVSPTTLPCYALSVGLPHARDAYYASMFDHIVPRSVRDAELVTSVVGAANVTLGLPDLALCAGDELVPAAVVAVPPGTDTDLLVCLTGSSFEGNPCAGALLDDLVCIIRAARSGQASGVVRLVAFDTGKDAATSDVAANAALAYRLEAALVDVVDESAVRRTADEVRLRIARAGSVLTMRYHAAVFAAIAGRPCYCLYTSTRLAGLVQDRRFTILRGHAMLVSAESDQPQGLGLASVVDIDAACDALNPARHQPRFAATTRLMRQWDAVIDGIVAVRRRKHILAPPDGTPYASAAGCTDPAAVFARLCPWLQSLLGLGDAEVMPWLAGTVSRSAVLAQHVDVAMAVARCLCYAVTGDAASTDAYGVGRHVIQDGWDLGRDIAALCGDVQLRRARDGQSALPATAPGLPDGQTLLALYEDDAAGPAGPDVSGVHRSGWAYAMRGLRGLAAASYMRDGPQPTRLLLDGYVDRTFSAAPDVLRDVGVLPYTRPWIGFVHHTFASANGGSSVACLMQRPLFLASLPNCRCLVVFSTALATQLRQALERVCVTCDVPMVRVMTHPTETPPASSLFSIVAFMSNLERKVVQIGAWLRHAYAIYDLPLSPSNWWNMSKAVLHGPAMDGSVSPPDFGSLMATAVAGMSTSRVGGGRRTPAVVGLAADWQAPGASGGRSGSRPWEMCREWNASAPALSPFLRGFVDSASARERSVSVLPHADNAVYDALLSKNVVFLSLEDASAVNTVLECVVRNTPIVVNRLPALEELLGPKYPGFYPTGDLSAAAVLLTTRVMDMTTYLANMDKSSLTLDAFVTSFHDLLVELGTE